MRGCRQRSRACPVVPPTAVHHVCLSPHPRSSACYLRVVVLSAAQFTHHSPVVSIMVSVVCAWSSALTRTTVRVAGHTTVLGACGSLIIGQLGIRPAGGRLIIVVLVRPRCPYRLRYLARLRKLIEVNRRYCRFIQQMAKLLFCKVVQLARDTKLTLTTHTHTHNRFTSHFPGPPG